jgi:hypothetical protein
VADGVADVGSGGSTALDARHAKEQICAIDEQLAPLQVCGDLRGQQRGRVRIIGSRLSPLFAQVNSAETIDALSQVRNQSIRFGRCRRE